MLLVVSSTVILFTYHLLVLVRIHVPSTHANHFYLPCLIERRSDPFPPLNIKHVQSSKRHAYHDGYVVAVVMGQRAIHVKDVVLCAQEAL